MVEILINEEKCTGCGDCVKVCLPEILFIDSNNCHLKEELILECLGCQSCVVVCPNEAIIVKD